MNSIDPKASMGLAQAQSSSGAAEGLADRLRSAAARGDKEGIREAARQFEGYFVQTMLKEMRRSSGSEAGLLTGKDMETFHSLFDEEIAGRISSGKGIGFASMIERSLGAYRSEEAQGAQSAPSSSGPTRFHRHARTDHHARPVHVPALAFPDGRSGFSWPLPDTQPGRISSGYGSRRDPIKGEHKHHGGMDIAAPQGTPILSMAAGTVVRADSSPSYGNVVDIDHGDGVVTRYAHQHELHVSVGDVVEAGEQVGTVGSTGRSTGNHLHLEVRVHGNRVDPHSFLSDSARK